MKDAIDEVSGTVPQGNQMSGLTGRGAVATPTRRKKSVCLRKRACVRAVDLAALGAVDLDVEGGG